MSEFGNGSGVDLEHQGKRLIQVYGDAPLTLDAPLDARCVYTLNLGQFKGHDLVLTAQPKDVRVESPVDRSFMADELQT